MSRLAVLTILALLLAASTQTMARFHGHGTLVVGAVTSAGRCASMDLPGTGYRNRWAMLFWPAPVALPNGGWQMIGGGALADGYWIDFQASGLHWECHADDEEVATSFHKVKGAQEVRFQRLSIGRVLGGVVLLVEEPNS